MSTQIKDIFDYISKKENHTFEINHQYLNKTKFEIETLNGYVPVVSMMLKEDTGVVLVSDNTEILVSEGHRMSTPSGIKYVRDLKVGDKLSHKDGEREIQAIVKGDNVLVYDLTLDSEDHLFLDENGFVHHNTYHITEGPRSLKALLGPAGGAWEYHSGTKAAPFAFYKTLFQERDKIIVFDEADSLLKNDDIVMMLKPILDTSGDNMAAYMAGTENMVGKSKQEIEDYCDIVDEEIANGTSIGTGKNDVKLPSKFKFTGGMIFISNMRAKEIEGAIMSRSIFIDVYLAQQDVLKRIESIALAKYKSFGAEYVEQLLEGLGQASKAPEVKVQYMTPEYARKHKPFTVRSMDLAHILKQSGLTRWAQLAQLYA